MSDTDKINRTMNVVRISNDSDDEYDEFEIKAFKYPAKDGQNLEFDTTKDACKRFGFYFGQQVTTPTGNAKVIGVRNGHLWFHIEKDLGATYWDNGTDNKALIEDLGIRLMENQFSEYVCKVKQIQHNGRNVYIVLNEQKSLSMLVTIFNTLLLRGKMSFANEHPTQIKMCQIGSMLYKYLDNHYKTTGEVATKQELTKYHEEEFPQLMYSGFSDVNVSFSGITKFDPRSIYKLFGFAQISLYHGWLFPENEEGYDMISELTHHELAAKMRSVSEAFPDMSMDFERVVEEFLAGVQLTNDGYSKIRDKLAVDEICVFYKNNQFYTLTKKDDSLLYTLEVGQNHVATTWNQLLIN